MNRIIGKKRVVILGFLFVCVAGGCSQSVPDVSYQIETDKPCQTMAFNEDGSIKQVIPTP